MVRGRKFTHRRNVFRERGQRHTTKNEEGAARASCREADSDVTRIVARDYLSEFHKTTLGTLVLGCTHYPILRDVISETVGREITLIDSGEATARDVESLLESSDLTHEDALGLYQERQLCDDLDHFYVTDAAERFAKVAERFLGSAPSILEAVEIWGHDELRTH